MSEIVNDILDQEIVDVTFSEVDTQDNINTIRHTHYGYNETYTQQLDSEGKHVPGTLWYAAIRDLPTTDPEKVILYTATDASSEEEATEFPTQAGREIFTREIANNLIRGYRERGDLDSRNVFDIFQGDSAVHAKKIGWKKLTDGSTQYSISAYNEETRYFNFSYAMSITISEDEKDIVSLQLNIEKCYDDYWNETTHSVNGSAFDDGNAFRHTISITDIEFADGNYDPMADLYFDFTPYLLSGVDAHILADGGEGEFNKIGVGDYMQIIVDKRYPETATEATGNLRITASSDTEVIGIDENVPSSLPTYIAKKPGKCTVTIGNEFDANLGTIDVEVVSGSDEPVVEQLGIAEVISGIEDGYDAENLTFNVDGSKGEATFKIRLNETGPYEYGELEGLAMLGETTVVGEARVEEDSNPNDDIVNLVLTPVSSGSSVVGITLPNGELQVFTVNITGEVVKNVSPIIDYSNIEGMEADPGVGGIVDVGLFRVSLSEGAKTFKASLHASILNSNDNVVINGDEIEYEGDANTYVVAEFKNADKEAGTVDIVITPKAVGTCEIKIPVDSQAGMVFKEYFRVVVEA